MCVLCRYLSLQKLNKFFKDREIWYSKSFIHFSSPLPSPPCPHSLSLLLGIYKSKYLTGFTSIGVDIYDIYSLQSCFLKSNEVLITGITFPVGLNDEDLSKQSFWGDSLSVEVQKSGNMSKSIKIYFLFKATVTQDTSNLILSTAFSWRYVTVRPDKNP